MLRLLIGVLLAFGFAKLLNAISFKAKPASRPVAFGLSCLVLIISLIILSLLKFYAYQELSSPPRNPLDVPGAFISAWVFYLSVKREQKNKKLNDERVIEPFKEKISESQQPVLEQKAVDCQPRDRKLPIEFDIVEAELENETKTCSACKKTIKLLAKKCRFCRAIFEQNEIEIAIKSKSIELLERKLEISLDDEVKKCPACAEPISVKSFKCEFCEEVFDPSDVEIRAKHLIFENFYEKSALSFKICPKCGHHDVYRDYTGSLWCPRCNKYVLLCSAPDIVTSKPESEPPVEKDTILDKPYILNRVNDAKRKMIITIVAGFVVIAGLTIVFIIGALDRPPEVKRNVFAGLPDVGEVEEKLENIMASEKFKKSGITLMEKGNYQQAINMFNKSVELNTLDHAAYNTRGEVYSKLNNYKQAMEDFNRAIIAINHGHEPNPKGFVGLAKILKEQNWERQEDLIQAKYYRNRGLAYEKLGNKNQAIEDLKIAAMVSDKEAQKYLLSRGMSW